MSDKLNIGCGEFKKTGYINLDYFSVTPGDVTHDLDIFPYPFSENQFSIIEARHVLEHLSRPFCVMKELFRITKPEGLLCISVPHFTRGLTHPEHKAGFDVSFPLYFNKNFIGGYQGFELELISMHLCWFGQPYLKKKTLRTSQYLLGKSLGFFIDCLANASPFLCSKLWCFWVGGFDEIEYVFRVKK
ncbi:MAG: methyltransferase domain-containing protein [Oligoflexia bacterium]|nr:methyltransferase domain-containing protein [Oligoflexia bacterium]